MVYNIGMKDRQVERQPSVSDAIKILFGTLPIEEQPEVLLELCDRYLSQQPRLNAYNERIHSIQEILREGTVSPVTIDGLTVHFDGRYPMLNGEPIKLTLIQQEILKVLTYHRGSVVSTESLFTAVWGNETPDGYQNRVYTHISRLRGALDPNDGYRFIKNNEFGYYVRGPLQNLEEE